MKGGSPNRFEILGVGRDMVGHQEPKILGGLISAPLIPAGIQSFQWNKIWQEGLLFFFIPVPFIPAEFGHSGIETGMFHGICRNGMQQNLVVCLFVCFTPVTKQTTNQTLCDMVSFHHPPPSTSTHHEWQGGHTTTTDEQR